MAPIVKNIQGIYGMMESAGDINKLYYLFANTLGFPEAFAPADHGSFRGGGVWIGNIWLKFITLHPTDYLMSNKPGKLKVLEIVPRSFEKSQKEFDKRGLEYRLDKATTVLDDGVEKECMGDLWLQAPPFKEIMLDIGWYNELAFKHFTSVPKAKNIDECNRLLKEKFDVVGGGLLGAKAVKEIELGVKDLKKDMSTWRTLLDPLTPEGNSWRIGKSPVLTLVPSKDYSVKSISIKVKSLRAAKKVLKMNGLLGESDENVIHMDPSKVNQLNIKFVK